MSETTQELVDALFTAGPWPDPALLEAILARGEEAIEPLTEVVRHKIVDWEDEGDALTAAVGLLGMLGARSAIPTLLEQYRRYDDDELDEITQTLGLLGGAEVVEPALEIGRDRALGWFPRAMALEAAQRAAGVDPVLRARVAEVLRELLADLVARARQLDSDDCELAGSLVGDLAELADPQARDLIRAAFEADIIEPDAITPEEVEELYREGGESVIEPAPWLDDYRQQYQEFQEGLEDQPPSVRDWVPAPPFEGLDEDFTPVTEPIRNTGPKLGRNDPCWCGSGKKYKKCHLREDQE